MAGVREGFRDETAAPCKWLPSTQMGGHPSVPGQPLLGLQSAVSNTVPIVSFLTRLLGLGVPKSRPAEHCSWPHDQCELRDTHLV